MTTAGRLREAVGASLSPPRDLPFVDALAVLAALALTYALRAKLNSSYQFEWASVAPFVRAALPVSLAAMLLSAAALSLYDRRAAAAGARAHLAAAAYATAAVTAIAVYSSGGQVPGLALLLTAGVSLAAFVHCGRRLYWRVAARPEADEGAG